MNIYKHFRRASVICLAMAALAPAQMAGHSMGSMAPVPAPDTLPAPQRMEGLGNSHLHIQTSSPEAQAWFDQGINEFHDFWDYEAERSFQQSIRVDPNCAMCYWGLAEALGFRGFQDAYQLQALDRAKKLARHAPKSEQLFIKAADYQTRGKGKKATETLRKLVALEPDNVQAKIFLAESLMDGFKDGEPKEGTQQGIDILTSILKDHPDDSATNHYWIHAMEPSNHPERAIGSATRLAGEAPASGHMVHMPGHIFYRTGDYASAEQWFARSTAVDEAYMDAQHVDADNDWNYVHNLQYGIANLMEEGRWQEAGALSSKLNRGRGQYTATLYVWSPRDDMARLSNNLPIAMRQGDWAQVSKLLADAKPDDKLPNLQFFAGQIRTYGDGMSKLGAGDLAGAESASKKLEADLAAAKAKLPAERKSKNEKPKLPVTQPVTPDAMMEPVLSNLAIMSLELRGSILAAKKDIAGAKPLFEDAAKKEKDLGYHEPPAFIQPVNETEGNVLLAAGDAEGAHAAFERALVERPNSGLALYGAARADEASGAADQAMAAYAKFCMAWKNADPNLPELKHAQQYSMEHMLLDGSGKKAE